ncbi:molybdenum ABC transporter, ATP-binding protein, putative [Trichomonas vaginalis G3]|uniref:Molybdenum ABC transporter, ATP-binding protein, putative n=1 Tax=Trichomonas vaginalis (strain ATCC PRA-98 / G3) TaxID=412133 RepID=A2F1F2_TRIV3|nr:hypothetical protein TVAGG3_0947650 [Trichomonas vaginalis G3]EAY01239.1 molybdenum ABC transporter, ATP-binding protein, putative [Trichomonas vaginalis G3]KAI5486980.1 hypothetical protein TVAGG3_0947650 [Trichomonas vaginalis G3]|eukprot:XP_001314054.1 molybdenum ABC transporter, ATP-binding protein [Trichomonas vaginalis G3]
MSEANSVILRASIESLQKYIEMQMSVISDTRKKLVFLKPQKKTLSFSSSNIASFDPVDPRIKREYLSKRMTKIAKLLKLMKIEKQNTKRDVQNAIDSMKNENISLQQQIDMLYSRLNK